MEIAAPIHRPVIFCAAPGGPTVSPKRSSQTFSENRRKPFDTVSPTACHGSSDCEPRWNRQFGHEISVLLPNRLKNKPTVAFLTPAGCIVGQALDDLVTRAAALVKRFRTRRLNQLRSQDSSFPDLAEVMLDMLTPAMVLEMNVARLEGWLEGETAEARFHSFVERFREPERARAFLREYPVLARLLLEQAHRWVDVSLELLERLSSDWTAIQSAFAPESDGGLGVLTGVVWRVGRSTLWKADPFSSSDSPQAGDWSTNPKPCRRRPFSGSPEVAERARQRSAIQDHHDSRPRQLWMGGVHRGRQLPMDDEVRRFYQRQGAYVAVLYLLEGTDFHSGNLIACGEHPVLVDLEALFHSQKIDPEPTERTADRIARQTISNSVLCTDLLPERVWSNSENEGVDISGLGTPEGQVTPHPLRQWEAPGTDSMHLVRKRKPIKTRTKPSDAQWNSGESVGLPAGSSGWLRCNVLILLANRHELLSEKGPLLPFRDDEVRAFLRSSRTYRHLLERAIIRTCCTTLWIVSGSSTSYGEKWSAGLSFSGSLRRKTTTCFEAISRHSRLAQIRATSGPARESGFTISSATRAFRSSGAVSKASATTTSRGRCGSQASMATLASERAEERRSRVLSRFPDPDPDRFLAAARAAGDRLSALAVRGDTDATWIGLDIQRERAWSIAPAGLDLSAGVPASRCLSLI